MPDTEFCLGPMEGYDAQQDVNDPFAQRETIGGSSVTETFRRSLHCVLETLQRVREAFSRRTPSTVIEPSQGEKDEGFCCGPTKEWLDEERRLTADSSQILNPDLPCVIGHRSAESNAMTHFSIA